ncbi:hypothetical protein PSTG_12344 [Puccinia striiformis f. sp. tritici PST-78]|uniref:DUF659 domain-containing protein n=1 Tax=Puccinia striiformis f. sp. tritici PST-78 TaxID=1165861 RepID=A0A0L0V5M4_9BASI|nr:hypothetical protein PSTG_12344 [Puccinia striiformis f. sp. tritici PST-78]
MGRVYDVRGRIISLANGMRLRSKKKKNRHKQKKRKDEGKRRREEKKQHRTNLEAATRFPMGRVYDVRGRMRKRSFHVRLLQHGWRGLGQLAQQVPQLCAIWAVGSDITRLYTAVLQSFIKTLEKHSGAMYLGLDAWQSPNGYDILGTVIYRLIEDDDGHTGAYLADTVRVIVEKFGVQNKICGIVTDDTSNNATMIEEIKKFKWPLFKGETH